MSDKPKTMATPKKSSVELVVKVYFDKSKTDEESVAYAMDTLIETAISTPGILDDYGDVGICASRILKTEELEVKNFAPDADVIQGAIGDWEISVGRMEDGSVHVNINHPKASWSGILGQESDA